MQLKFALILLSLGATSVLSHPIGSNQVQLATRDDHRCDNGGYHCHHHGHHYKEKPFDVLGFFNGMIGQAGNTNKNPSPDVKNTNLGEYWGRVAFAAFAPRFEARSFNSREALEARNFDDDAINLWAKFAQDELELPKFVARGLYDDLEARDLDDGEWIEQRDIETYYD